MTRLFFFTFLTVLSYPLIGQETIGAPYNPDANNDSLITVPDIMSILPLFGQEFLPSEDDLDSENEIQSLYLSGDTLYLIPAGGFILLSDLAGPQGEVGPEGPAGAPGEPGADGVGVLTTLSNSDGSFTLVFTDGTSYTSPVLIGPQGPQGEVGPTGEMGPTGPQGETGPAGEVGPAGSQGEQGPMGEVGPAGADGIGVSSVAIENDSLMLTLTSGEVQNAGRVVPALDSLLQLALSTSNLGSCDLRFPQGLGGTPIHQEIGSSSSYIVPEDKVLYITSIQCSAPISQPTAGIRINGQQVLWGNFGNDNGPETFSGSVIAGPGDALERGSPFSSTTFSGMLVDIASVQPVTHNLITQGDYSIPEGKEFVLLQCGGASIDGVEVSNFSVGNYVGNPYRVLAGSLITTDQADPDLAAINGYLVSDDYFTNCGGSSAGGISDSNEGSSGCDQRFPFGYEGTPVYHVGWSEDYTVPEGYTLIINHPFQSEESLTINGYGLLYGSYNQGNGQGFSASIIAASGDVIGGQMNFAGMLFPNDDSITPVTVNLNDVGNYEVPSGMKFMWLQAKGDFSVNGVALYSSNTHWSFGQPLQLGTGDLLSLTSVGQGAPNEGTINGYLVSDSYFTNCGGSSAGGSSDSNDGSLQTGVCVADLSNFSESSQEHYVVSAVECSVLIVTNSPCCVTHEVYLPEGVDGQLLKVDGDSNHSVNIVNGTGAQTLIGSLANGSLSLYWYEGAWRRL